MPKSKKSAKGSSTAGKTKGSNCHRSQSKTRMSLDARWYRTDPIGYAKACKEIDDLKGNRILKP